jgi:hypothetical protein
MNFYRTLVELSSDCMKHERNSDDKLLNIEKLIRRIRFFSVEIDVSTTREREKTRELKARANKSIKFSFFPQYPEENRQY